MTAAAYPVLADRLIARPTALTDALMITSGAALTAVLAQVVVPLWPVPVTGQTLAVLLVGATLGAWRGAASLGLYALIGIAGVPVFNSGASGIAQLAGPTGGYIVGFVLAAYATGWCAQRQWDRGIVKAAVTMAVGTLVTFAIGLPWLAYTLDLNLSQTLSAGLYPFIPGGIVKAAIAAALLPLAWRMVQHRDDV